MIKADCWSFKWCTGIFRCQF